MLFPQLTNLFSVVLEHRQEQIWTLGTGSLERSYWERTHDAQPFSGSRSAQRDVTSLWRAFAADIDVYFQIVLLTSLQRKDCDGERRRKR